MNPIKLHAQQPVSEALALMDKDKYKSLPVYQNDRIIGSLHYDELNAYLNEDKKDEKICANKLQINLIAAMDGIASMKLEYYHNALRVKHKKTAVLRFTAIAAILFIITALACFFLKPSVPSNPGNLIVAGLNKVVLTFADGKKIALDETKGGIRLTENKLTYQDGTPISAAGTAGVASVSTSHGVVYQVQLPDGTRVWLNATSTLKLPASFTNTEKRLVQLSGEAYFEVAKVNYATANGLKRLPFIVASIGQEIEVLGTHFNVKAYPNEPAIKTTLLEGLVRVSPLSDIKSLKGADPSLADPLIPIQEQQGIMLKPNEEAVLKGNKIAVNKVNASEAIAWRTGDYIYRNTPLENVMLVIARWYDVEVIYQSNLHKRNELLGGVMTKSADMQDILKSLELTAKVRFKVDGKRVTVMQQQL
ncbi:ferric-dicitrate binding protein FerR (iron transport regulator) [Pedobacter sp. AK017]|uniref:FecR domain-containing protein n=1 Tax=Pedobacter sp. AK017 TaxID=2723073 RepID=UPI00161B856C|nr:FecR domain-containing protein [Pedobacter sp. AK017]MBB5440104.1 ferric-dicitrate binding protein FerR (iron transport regulator) [Pedobacter sp. AK017]